MRRSSPGLAREKDDKAFHNLDGQHVLPYYHEPLMLIGGTGVRVMATHAEAEAWMNSFWARLRERGFARASKFSPLHIKQVSTSAAVASVRFVRYDASGRKLEGIGATYILHKLGAVWKIVVIVTHDPGGVLRLD